MKPNRESRITNLEGLEAESRDSRSWLALSFCLLACVLWLQAAEASEIPDKEKVEGFLDAIKGCLFDKSKVDECLRHVEEFKRYLLKVGHSMMDWFREIWRRVF